MNTLYIGPYKHNSCLSLSSIDIIETLQKNSKISNLTIRPLFINDQIININNLIVSNLENKDLSESTYDCVIQHGPITLLDNSVPLGKKNIAIPLFDKVVGNESYSEILNSFDMVLCDSREYGLFLHENYNLDNIQVFSYNKLYNTSLNINFAYNSNDIKLYWIGQYDSLLIEKIVTSFLLAFHDRQDVALFLFLNQDHTFIAENLDEKIEKIKSRLNIVNKTNNINIILKPLGFDDINAIHNTCDMFLDITKNNNESMLNLHIAKLYNKKIINCNEKTWELNTNKHVFGEYIQSFNEIDLSKQLSKDIDVEISNEPDTQNKTIVDVLCL
jgi:hypothetical protein